MDAPRGSADSGLRRTSSNLQDWTGGRQLPPTPHMETVRAGSPYGWLRAWLRVRFRELPAEPRPVVRARPVPLSAGAVSKDDLPDIPSWDELGISPEELAELEAELEKAEGEDPSEPGAARVPGPGADAPRTGAKGTSPGVPKSAEPSAREQKKARKAHAKAQKQAQKDRKRAAAAAAATAGAAGVGDGGASQAGDGSPEPASEKPTAPATPGFRGPLTALLLLGMAWAFSSERAAPAPLGTNAPDSVFAADRAMLHMESIARAPHPPGSPEHARVREYLLSELRKMGLQPTVQTTTSVLGSGQFRLATTVRNVLARIPGSATTGTILLTAHYDGREVSHAAGDDASGVSAILEALRALSTGEPLLNDIMVLITDAEELGLMGARAFVDQHPWMSEVTLVISVEMRGGAGPSIMFETGRDNGWIVDQLKAGNPDAFGNSLTHEVYKRLPNDTDFTPFKEAGKQGLNYAGIGDAHVYHQTYDTPENFSRRTLQHHGVNLLSMVRHLGNLELGTISAPDKVYFNMPFLGLVTYSRLWSYGLSGLLLLLVLGAAGFVRSAGGRLGGIGAGALAGVVAAGSVGGLGLLMVRLLPAFHPETGQLQGSLFHSEGWYVAGLAALSVAVVTLIFGVLRRWFSLAELSMGAALLPVLAGIVLGIWQPFSAMNMQWPALCALGGVAVVAGVARSGRPGLLRWVLLIALAAPVLALLVPLTELLWLAMNVSLAPALGVVMTVALLSALPLIDILREPNGWWATALGAVAAAGLIGIGILNAAPSPERPAPSTLIYAVDRESGESLWLTDGPDSPASGEKARAWARDRVGEPSAERSFASFMGRERTYAIAAAPARDLALPLVSVIEDSTSGGLRIAATSRLGAEMLLFRFPEGSPQPTAINGVALDGSEPIRLLEHWGEPVGSVTVDFASSAGDSLRFSLVEHLFRPTEVVGPEPFRRPADLAPNIRRWSDRAMIRTPFVVTGGTAVVAGADTSTAGSSPIGAEPDTAVAAVLGEAADSTATPDTVAVPDTATVPDTVVVPAPDSAAVPDSAAAPDQVSNMDTLPAVDPGTPSVGLTPVRKRSGE